MWIRYGRVSAEHQGLTSQSFQLARPIRNTCELAEEFSKQDPSVAESKCQCRGTRQKSLNTLEKYLAKPRQSGEYMSLELTSKFSVVRSTAYAVDVRMK